MYVSRHKNLFVAGLPAWHAFETHHCLFCALFFSMQLTLLTDASSSISIHLEASLLTSTEPSEPMLRVGLSPAGRPLAWRLSGRLPLSATEPPEERSAAFLTLCAEQTLSWLLRVRLRLYCGDAPLLNSSC